MKRPLGLLVFMLGGTLPLSMAAAEPLTEDGCSVLVTTPGAEKPALRDVPGMRVIDRTPEHPLTILPVEGVKVNGVMCWRSEARFAENDYLVARSGLSLYIKTDHEDESQNRTVVLDYVNGGYRIRLVDGPKWSDAERAEVMKVLRDFPDQPDPKAADSPASTASPAAKPDKPASSGAKPL